MSPATEAVDGTDVPAPLALHEYFRLLDDFAASRACRDAYVGELLEARDWGDRERTEYEQGQSSLWRLIPPVTLDEIKEADFDPPANIALALAIIVWGRHALHHWDGRMTGRRMPAPLPEVERLARHVAEALEQAGRKSARGAIGRLDALRLELQEQRQSLEAAARAKEQAGDVVKDGMASARRDGDTPRGLFRWLPRRFRKVTEPGMGALRRMTAPGIAFMTGEVPAQVDWDIDPQVPTPLGVYDYVQALSDRASGKRLELVFLHGLIGSVGLTADLDMAFAEGRNGLWILIPPITPTQVAEANLPRPAARALAVALFLRVHHALHHYLPEQSNKQIPPVLADCGEMLTAVKLSLESGRGDEDDPVVTALNDVALRLAARGVSAGGIVDQRREEIRDIKRQEAEERREAAREAAREDDVFTVETKGASQQVTFSMIAGASMPRLVVGAVLIVLLGSMAAYTNVNTTRLPPADSYKMVPTVAIIRHQDEIQVRVPSSWMNEPQERRETAMKSLYQRFAKELGADAVPVIIVSLQNLPYGGVAGERVWWIEANDPNAAAKAAKKARELEKKQREREAAAEPPPE